MQVNITKIIDQYLLGELSPKDRLAFEEKLTTNPELKTEVELQQNVHEAAQRASIRLDIQQIARRYRINRIIRWGAAGIGIVAVLIASTFWIQSTFQNHETIASDSPKVAFGTAQELNEFVQFDNVPVHYFSIKEEGDFKLSEEGVLLSIPKNAFLLNDTPYSGPSILQYQEAIDAATIIKGRLNTMAGDRLLETQGMFSVQAYTPDGKKLDINPEVGIYMQVPVDECKSDMKLFEGVQKTDGTMDWQNPVSLEKIPMSVPMSDLDFYPEGYESKLNSLKWKTDKKSRDSLYLSFEDISMSNTNQLVSSTQSILPKRHPNFNQNSSYSEISQEMFFPELEAEFPGGEKALKLYLAKNLKYPQYAILQDLSGIVYVGFTTDEKGKINNVYIESGVHPLLDKEALRLVNKMPDWVPASNNEMPVSAFHRIPIKFILDGDNSSNPFVGRSATATSFPQGWKSQGSGRGNADSTGVTRYPFVSPSKVLAMWKPKFNTTNLATREFERRMKAIHSTCSDVVLAKYTGQLNKRLSEIDREVAVMGYSEFHAFADEQIGAVNPNNPHLKNLQAFYEEGISLLRKEAKKSKNWEQNLRARRDTEVAEQRKKHSERTEKNKEKSKKDEAEINKKRALKKTKLNGPSRTIRQAPNYQATAAKIYPQFNRTASFTVRRSGAVNLDRYRPLEPTFAQLLREKDAKLLDQNQQQAKRRVELISQNATDQRKTVKITENGGSTTITYNEFTLEVDNSKNYVKLFGYLFPSKMSSYQLIDFKDGKFEYPLNGDIIYDVCVVGITEDGYEYFQKQTLNGGDLGTIEMKRLTELDLEASIRQLNKKRISRPAPILGELDWVRAESSNYREQKRRRDMYAFRRDIEETIFPCYSGGDITEVREVKAVIDDTPEADVVNRVDNPLIKGIVEGE